MGRTTGSSNAAAVSATAITHSEAEILQLIETSKQQYEECMRLADTPDYSEVPAAPPMDYSWNTPIGLVIREDSSAHVV